MYSIIEMCIPVMLTLAWPMIRAGLLATMSLAPARILTTVTALSTSSSSQDLHRWYMTQLLMARVRLIVQINLIEFSGMLCFFFDRNFSIFLTVFSYMIPQTRTFPIAFYILSSYGVNVYKVRHRSRSKLVISRFLDQTS